MQDSATRTIGAVAAILILLAAGFIGWFCLAGNGQAQAQTAYHSLWRDAGLPEPDDADLVDPGSTIADLKHGMKAQLTVPQSLDEAVNFYESSLCELGWNVHRELVRDRNNYCQEFQNGNRLIQIHATSGSNNTSIVKIFFHEVSTGDLASVNQATYRQRGDRRHRRLSFE